MFGGPDYSRDFTKGKEALKYIFSYSESKGKLLPFLSADNFIEQIRQKETSKNFVENLGYTINTFLANKSLNDAEVKEALEKASDEIAGVWHDRFSPQAIINSLIQMSSAFKIRYIWSAPAEAAKDFAWNVYDTTSTVAQAAVTTAKDVAVSASNVAKYLPYAAASLGLVLVYLYLKPKSYARSNPRYQRMDLDEIIPEHKRLVRVLKRGKKKELSKEAKRQAKELKQYKRERAK